MSTAAGGCGSPPCAAHSALSVINPFSDRPAALNPPQIRPRAVSRARPQVLGLCEKPRDPPLRHIVVDTPGQIEIFTWSASGAIITELFASSFRTVVAYVVDTPRCVHAQTFMSNMLQACSILYKSQLPLLLARAHAHTHTPPLSPSLFLACSPVCLVRRHACTPAAAGPVSPPPLPLPPPHKPSSKHGNKPSPSPNRQVFNKTDVARHDFALNWMSDFEAYADALEADASYAATLSRSLSLVLDEFYSNLTAVGVSAVTGEGMDELFQARRGAFGGGGLAGAFCRDF